MKAKKLFRTVETHTLGQPTRNVVSGFRNIPGETMAEKYSYMKDHEDWFVNYYLMSLAVAKSCQEL